MFTRKEKEALNDIARSIQEVYNFSLIPEDKNFKRPEEITEQMGGGMLVDKSTFSVKVCRCGNGFLITMPDTRDMTEEISWFEEGIATLVFGMKFNVSENDFMKNPNMKAYVPNYREQECICYLSDELACPNNKILATMMKCQDANGTFCVKDVSAKMGLRRDFLESRMISCGLISRW